MRVDLQDLTLFDTMRQMTLSEYGIHVWRFPLIGTRLETAASSQWLSERENARLDRILSRVKRDGRAVAWGRLRYILSRYLDCAPVAIQIAREGFGRPEITYPEHSGVRFNLSHSGSFGLVGVSRNSIGVDIEKVDVSLRVARLATRFFTPNEADKLLKLSEEERIQTFFRLWVLKEAYLKAHDSQVPAGLSQCEMTLEADGPQLVESDFGSKTSQNMLVELPVSAGYVAALVGLQEKADISMFDL